jgi:hypothetical protein
MTTDLTMLKASLEASQAAIQAASYALQSVQAAVSALLLQAQPEPSPGVMHDLHKETEAPSVACSMPVFIADALPEVEQEPDVLNPELAPLTPEERKCINAQLGDLNAAGLKAFTVAFRAAFDVPAEVKMIKGEITQQRHGAWILNYLSELSNGTDQ